MSDELEQLAARVGRYMGARYMVEQEHSLDRHHRFFETAVELAEYVVKIRSQLLAPIKVPTQATGDSQQ